ncbi:MAG: ribbon-helix-helix domain-containing protein [Thermoguttaceae bacterium]
MTARKSFLLRISPALYEALESWAQQELRSVNGQIEYLLKEAVRERGSKLVEDIEAAPGEDPQADSQGPQ